jgi:hypothetical protein
LALHEREQICATKSSLSSTPNAQTRERSHVRPSAERSLADVQELRGGADVEQLVAIGHSLSRPWLGSIRTAIHNHGLNIKDQ